MRAAGSKIEWWLRHRTDLRSVAGFDDTVPTRTTAAYPQESRGVINSQTSSSFRRSPLANGLVGLLVVGVLGYCGCREDAPPPLGRTSKVGSQPTEDDHIRLSSGAASGFNVLLITLDTTRADHLGCYGHRAIKTPNIDAMASRGVRFARAFTPSPSTLPSHSTILTGLYPHRHGARTNGSYKLGPENHTLAEVLKTQGYTTMAAVSCYVLDSRFGSDQGFDVYDDDLSRGVKYSNRAIRERPAEFTNESVFGWLEQHVRSKFFVWVHYFDAHAPYVPPEPYRSQYATQPYDGEIAYVDEQIGILLAKLDALGLRANTLIIIAGDHGEGLGEHGETAHRLLLYDTTLQVPLIFHNPALFTQSYVVDHQVTNSAIMPTVLDLLGIATDLPFDGVSLLRPADQWPQQLYAETITTLIHHGWAPLFALRDSKLKYIHSPRPELYDTVEDPNELVDLVGKRPEDVVALAAALNQHIGNDPFGEKAIAQATVLDRGTIAKLAALGYVGNVVDPQRIDMEAAGRMNPKDAILRLEKVEQAGILIEAGNFHEGVALLETALEELPDSVYALHSLGGAYLTMGRTNDALRLFLRSLAIDARSATVHASIARIYIGQRRFDESRAMLDRAKALDPKCAAVYAAQGTLAASLGRPNEAARLFEQAIEMDPGTTGPETLVEMGLLHLRALDYDKARKAFARAIEIDAFNGLAHAGLGAVLVEEDKNKEAAEEFKVAVRFAPNNPVLLANQAGLYDRLGEYKKARSLADQALGINPKCAPALNNLGLIVQHTGDLDRAMELFNMVLENDPRELASRINLALCYLSRGREGDAAEQFEETLKHNPDMPIALANLGVYRANQGRPALALDFFERALRADPTYALAHAHYGTLLSQSGRASKALFHLKRALALNPTQPRHEQLEEQIRHLEQSLRHQRQPDSSTTQTTPPP